MRQTIDTAYTAAAPYNTLALFLSLVFFVMAKQKEEGETPVSQSLSAVGLSV